MDPLLELRREGKHQPANNNGNAQKRQENENTVAELFSWLCLVDQRKNDGYDQCEEEQRAEVGHCHGFRPWAMSKASSTMR